MNTIHVSAVLVGERGVLVRGAPGSGKSALVFGLLSTGNAWLIADDRVILTAAHGRLVASAPAEIAGLLEIRGQGIIERPLVSPARVHLLVDLLPEDECPRLPEAAEASESIEGVALPRLVLPIGAGDGPARVGLALSQLNASEI